MVGVSTPPVQPVIIPKVHCQREGFVFQLYFFSHPLPIPPQAPFPTPTLTMRRLPPATTHALKRCYSGLDFASDVNATMGFAVQAASVVGTISYRAVQGAVSTLPVQPPCPNELIQRIAMEAPGGFSGVPPSSSSSAQSEEIAVLKEELVRLRADQLEILRAIQASQEVMVQQQQHNVPSQIITKKSVNLKSAKLPSTPLSRAVNLTGLATRLAVDVASRKVFGKRDTSPGVLSNKALDLLVDRLCKMRGAALKLGQMLSIQDSTLVPPHVLEAFKKVREHSYTMPDEQLEQILCEEYGRDWENRFVSFDRTPVAAASLGQVHRASVRWGAEVREVAVKVQFQGVADSIGADVTNLRWLFSFGILPKGLYVENVLRELQRELTRECDYIGEADRQRRYLDALEADPERAGGLRHIHVPEVHDTLSTKRILVTEWVNGSAADCLFDSSFTEFSQAEKNAVGEAFLRLTLKELFEWRFMQTDPSFANFMYNAEEQEFWLIDFGAARAFEKDFIESYLLVVYGATVRDRALVLKESKKLGFLTGEENDEMLDAHFEAACLASLPFATRGPADFKALDLSNKMSPYVRTMLQHRLTAPPLEVYSLHRRLNGCFQLMTKLGADVDCRRVFIDVLRGVQNLSPHIAEQLTLKY